MTHTLRNIEGKLHWLGGMVIVFGHVMKHCQKAEWRVGLVMCIVKIFIMVMFSNAMNPREILPVLSLHEDAVTGLYARSRSASLGLPQLGQTRIISWPDYSGFQDLVCILWPMLHILMVRRPSPQAGKPEPFTSHFGWLGVHQPRPNQDHLFHLVYLHLSKVSRSPKLPRYPGQFSLPVY